MGAVRFGVGDLAHLRFAVSPLWETVASLRAVADPGRHAVHLPWIKQALTVREDREGLLAGLSGFPRMPAHVVVLAVDMPLVTTGTVERLLAAVDGHDGALLVDAASRRQYLCAAYRTEALLAAAPALEEQHGLAVHAQTELLHRA